MNKILVLAALVAVLMVATTNPAIGSLVVFSENVGTSSGEKSFATNDWQTPSLSFTGTGDTRSTTPSTGYTGASGGRNVFLTTGGTRSLTISGIDTTGLVANSFVLSFGAFKSTTASNMTELQISYSSDGVNFNNLITPAQPTGSGTANWRLITLNGITLPTVSNLRLRWLNTAASGPQFRLDDISLSATAVPEPSAFLLVGSIIGAGLLRRRRA